MTVTGRYPEPPRADGQEGEPEHRADRERPAAVGERADENCHPEGKEDE